MGKKVEVTRIIDGDTFVGKNGNQEKIYRLSGVDTPEKGKPGYDAAKVALRNIIGGKAVSAEQLAVGYYGRSVVNVKTSTGKSVNNAMKKYEKRL